MSHFIANCALLGLINTQSENILVTIKLKLIKTAP
jgi:hypothetical protein